MICNHKLDLQNKNCIKQNIAALSAFNSLGLIRKLFFFFIKKNSCLLLKGRAGQVGTGWPNTCRSRQLTQQRWRHPHRDLGQYLTKKKNTL